MAKFVVCAAVAVCVVAMVSAATIPPELVELRPEVRKVCLEETGADEALIDKANNGDISNDEKFKCYMKCTLQQLGAMTRKGINFDSMVRMAPAELKDRAHELVKACKDTKPTKEGDMCDLVYEASKCFYSHAPEYYFVL